MVLRKSSSFITIFYYVIKLWYMLPGTSWDSRCKSQYKPRAAFMLKTLISHVHPIKRLDNSGNGNLDDWI